MLVPAVAMRLWAEERKSGTIELLMTLPIAPWQAILGKFLAAWAFIGVALLLTFPIWITVNVLGDPDNGVIIASYIGSFLMAGAYLAIGSFISALTKNQVIAFIVSALICFLFIMAGLNLVLGFLREWAPAFIVSGLESMSFLSHFQQITRGHHLVADGDLLSFDDRILPVREHARGRAEESRVRKRIMAEEANREARPSLVPKVTSWCRQARRLDAAGARGSRASCRTA